MWGELERSPMLAAPGSADVTRLSTYTIVIGPDDDDVQAANDLCKKYLPLAQSIARKYQGRGIDDSDLDFAAEYGLAAAVLKFDPDRGAFGSYAKFWIKGEITRLFKLKGDALNNAQSLTKTNCGEEEFHQRDVTDERTFAPSID